MNAWMSERISGWRVGWKVVRIDGWMDSWTEK